MTRNDGIFDDRDLRIGVVLVAIAWMIPPQVPSSHSKIRCKKFRDARRKKCGRTPVLLCER
jgi:hypothetical protein